MERSANRILQTRTTVVNFPRSVESMGLFPARFFRVAVLSECVCRLLWPAAVVLGTGDTTKAWFVMPWIRERLRRMIDPSADGASVGVRAGLTVAGLSTTPFGLSWRASVSRSSHAPGVEERLPSVALLRAVPP